MSRAVGRAVRWLPWALVLTILAVGSLAGFRAVWSPAIGTEARVADPNLDSDGDGLPDLQEVQGWTDQERKTYTTDPKVADTDGDGLTDGEEAGARVSATASASVYLGFSDPSLEDTDGDGVGDGDEYFLATNPLADDSDGDGLSDEDELDFGSDPLADNPDEDDYSDKEERERGSTPLSYDESGWKAKVAGALTVLKFAISAADKISGGGKVKAAAAAIEAAKVAGVAAPVIWNALRQWDASDIDFGELRDEVYGDDMDELGEPLEGGQVEYVAYVARAAGGDLAYVGITDDFESLVSDHGGTSDLSLIGGSEPLPLNQARGVAEAVIKGLYENMSDVELANTRHAIDPASNLYAPATKWGAAQLEETGFEW